MTVGHSTGSDKVISCEERLGTGLTTCGDCDCASSAEVIGRVMSGHSERGVRLVLCSAAPVRVSSAEARHCTCELRFLGVTKEAGLLRGLPSYWRESALRVRAHSEHENTATSCGTLYRHERLTSHFCAAAVAAAPSQNGVRICLSRIEWCGHH